MPGPRCALISASVQNALQPPPSPYYSMVPAAIAGSNPLMPR
jgi:hypothetical protein